MRSKILVAAVIMALGFFAIASSPSLAAPGGKGKGKPGGGGTTTSRTLTYAPNPVALNGMVTVTGTGFAANSQVGVGFSGWITWFYTTTDGSGSFTWTYPTPMTYCGNYRFDAIQNSVTTSVYVQVC